MKLSKSFRFLPILILCVGIFNSSFSQNKIERESSIKAREVPSAAIDWLNDSFENLKNPKWFLEYSQNGKSYEAKFNFKGHFHSVEFDSLGNVQDVEIEINESEVARDVWAEIQSYFVAGYGQVKVEKIQRQLTGSKSELEDFFDEDENEGIVTRYEIVYQGKNNLWELWEALFDDSGQFISKLKVEIPPSNNLIF
jgi:hypothetical protein